MYNETPGLVYSTVRRKIMLRIIILILAANLLVSTVLAQNDYYESKASDHQNNLMCNHNKFLKCIKSTKEKCIEAFVKTENECAPLAERRDGEGSNWEGMERFSNCYRENINNNLGVKKEKLSECSPLLAPDLKKDLREKFKDNPKLLRELEETLSKEKK